MQSERKTGEDVVMRTWKWVNTENRKTETEVERCSKKIHEGESSKDRRSTRPENMEIETKMHRQQVGNMPKKNFRYYIQRYIILQKQCYHIIQSKNESQISKILQATFCTENFASPVITLLKLNIVRNNQNRHSDYTHKLCVDGTFSEAVVHLL